MSPYIDLSFCRIAHWDVNNEMLHGSYFADKLGPNIRDWMYKTVHEEDKKSRLFLNDFDVVANSFFTQVNEMVFVFIK